MALSRFTCQESRNMIQRSPAKQSAQRAGFRVPKSVTGVAALVSFAWSASAWASEADLALPDLSSVQLFGQTNGRTLLIWGLLICVLGLLFGWWHYAQLRRLPVHRSLLAISHLTHSTSNTYPLPHP